MFERFQHLPWYIDFRQTQRCPKPIFITARSSGEDRNIQVPGCTCGFSQLTKPEREHKLVFKKKKKTQKRIARDS